MHKKLLFLLTVFSLIGIGVANADPPDPGDCDPPPLAFTDSVDIATPEGGDGSAEWNADCSELTIVASGADIWGNSDQFRYTYIADVPGNWVMACKADISGAPHAWAKLGIMVRNAITAGSEHLICCGTGNNNCQMQGRRVPDSGSHGCRQASFWANPDLGYLALERQDDVIFGYISDDAMKWRRVFRQAYQETSWMGDTVNVGLAVTSHDGANLATGVFSEISFSELGDLGTSSYPSNVACADDGAGNVVVSWDPPAVVPAAIKVFANEVEVATLLGNATSYTEALPAGYTVYEVKSVIGCFLGGHGYCSINCAAPISLTSADINSAARGWTGETVTDGCQRFDITAAGDDIWGGCDQCRYAYTQVPGEFIMAANVDASDAPGTWGRHGIMIRAHLGCESRMRMIALAENQNGVYWETRDSDGGGVGHRGGNAQNLQNIGSRYRVNVAMVRSGDDVQGYWSADGLAWNAHPGGTRGVGDYGPAPLVGLATHSWEWHADNQGKLKSATFKNVILAGATKNLTCATVGADVVVTWEDVGSVAAQSYRILANGAEIGTAPAGTYAFNAPIPAGITTYQVNAIHDLLGNPTELGGGETCTAVDLRPWASVTIGQRNAHGCKYSNAWNPERGGNRDILDDDVVNNPWDNWNNTVYSGDDWVGVELRGPNGELNVHRAYSFEFMEGPQFDDGGAFETTGKLQILEDGKWVDTGLNSTPPYAGPNGTGNETFVWTFGPGTLIAGARLYGQPWGTRGFISARKVGGTIQQPVGAHPEVTVSAPDTAEFGDIVGASAVATDAEGGVTILGWDLNVKDPVDLVFAGIADVALPMTTFGEVTISCYVQDSDGNVSIGQADIVVGGPTSIKSDDPNHFEGGGWGFIKTWLILGPLAQGGSAGPPLADMRKDFLTDGVAVTEANVRPYDGMSINVDYNAAFSTGLLCDAWPDTNPGAVPTFFVHMDSDDTINHWVSVSDRRNRDSVFGGTNGLGGDDPNDMVVYHCVYVRNNTPDPLDVTIGGSSDDSLQVLVNGIEAIGHSIPRGYGGTHEVQDRGDAVLQPGTNLIMAKVWEGGGGSGLRLRIEERGTEVALTPPTITLHGVPNAPGLSVSYAVVKGLALVADTDADRVIWDFDPSDGIQADAEGTELNFDPPIAGPYDITAVALNNGGEKGFGNPEWAGATLATVFVDTRPPILNPVTPPALPLPLNAKYFAQPSLAQGTFEATFELVAGPAGATINPATGRVEWLITAAEDSTFTVKVSNPFGEDSTTWTITGYPDQLCDDFDDDPLANPLWALEDPNPGTVFSTAGSKFTWDQPSVSPTTGDDFDNWCGFNRTPFLYYPVGSLMDFSIQCRLDYTRTPDTNVAVHNGLMLDIPEQNRAMYGFNRDFIRAEHCSGWMGSGDGDGGGPFPREAWVRIDKLGTFGQYNLYYKRAEGNPWILHATYARSDQPVRAGLFVKNWGGGGAPATLTNFYYACLTGVAYPPQGLDCTVDGDAVNLSWTLLSTANAAIKVYRGDEEIADLPGDATSYTDADPGWAEGLDSKGYTVRVVALDGLEADAGCSVDHVSEGYIVFQDGVWPTPDYDGCADSYIIYYRSWETELNAGGRENLEEGDWNGGHDDHKEILIKFDLGDFSAPVLAAELRMWYWYERRTGVENVDNEHASYAHPVLKEWNEGRGVGGADGDTAIDGEVTWQDAQKGVLAWTKWDDASIDNSCGLAPGNFPASTGGCVGPQDLIVMNASSNETYGGGDGQKWVTWDVTQIVAAHAAGNLDNNGFKVTQQSSTAAPGAYSPCQDYKVGAYNFVSSDHATAAWARPMLIIKYALFTCPTNLACSAAGQTVTVTWKNQSQYDTLTLSGLPGGDISVDPAAETFVAEGVPCGPYNLELTAAGGGQECTIGPCAVTVDLPPPENVACTLNLNDATVTWTNAGLYEQIVVTVDGEEAATLAGDATECTVEDLGPGEHTICVVVSDSGCELDPVCCDPLDVPMLIRRGDANNDGGTDVSDAIWVLQYLFNQGDEPPCMDAADSNDDGKIDLADGTNILFTLFASGTIPPPTACEGEDTTEDDLGCEVSACFGP